MPTHRQQSIANLASPRDRLNDLVRTILSIDDPADLESFLGDLCSDKELEALAERWTIARLLQMGFSYRTVARKTGASSATISRMASLLKRGSGGLRGACARREQRLAYLRTVVPQAMFPRLTALVS